MLPAVLEKYLQKGKEAKKEFQEVDEQFEIADLPAQDQVTYVCLCVCCLLYTSPSPRD